MAKEEKIMAQTFENLEKYQGCSQELIEQAVCQATDIVKGNLKDFTDFFQSLQYRSFGDTFYLRFFAVIACIKQVNAS